MNLRYHRLPGVLLQVLFTKSSNQVHRGLPVGSNPSIPSRAVCWLPSIILVKFSSFSFSLDELPGYNDAPELRSVVLDSAFPPSVYLIRTIVRSDHDFILQLLEECQADAACNKAYPKLKERLAALLNNLEEGPLTTNGETVTLDDVVEQLTFVGGTRELENSTYVLIQQQGHGTWNSADSCVDRSPLLSSKIRR